jgi:hypothetical protein
MSDTALSKAASDTARPSFLSAHSYLLFPFDIKPMPDTSA